MSLRSLLSSNVVFYPSVGVKLFVEQVQREVKNKIQISFSFNETNYTLYSFVNLEMYRVDTIKIIFDREKFTQNSLRLKIEGVDCIVPCNYIETT